MLDILDECVYFKGISSKNVWKYLDNYICVYFKFMYENVLRLCVISIKCESHIFNISHSLLVNKT